MDYVEPAEDLIYDPPFPRGESTLLELGSGSGLVASIVAQNLHPGKDLLIATDLPEVCPLLEKNLRDFSAICHVRPLAWGDSASALSIHSELLSSRYLSGIICSDLIYFPQLLAPLLRTLIQLTSSPFASETSPVTIIISYQVRSLAKETSFWNSFGLWFEYRPVLMRNRKEDGEWHRLGSSLQGPTFVFVAHRRPESLSWNVPADDVELLGGVGAQGNTDKKSDDTFESLLFLLLDEIE